MQTFCVINVLQLCIFHGHKYHEMINLFCTDDPFDTICGVTLYYTYNNNMENENGNFRIKQKFMFFTIKGHDQGFIQWGGGKGKLPY